MSEYTPPPPPPSDPSGWGQQPGLTSPPAKGFFGALFDFSFNSFVTPSIVKVVYVLATIALAVGFVGFLIAAIATGESTAILFTLILGPILAILYLALIRMTLEFYYALVRMSEDIHRGRQA
jgi:uncharacterized protein DUF4282